MKQTRLAKMLAVWSGLRDCGGDSAGAGNHNNDYDSGPGNRYNDNPGDNDQQCRHDRDIHAGFGLLYVPNNAECGTGALLLHQRHGDCGPGRPHRNLVGHSPGHAGNYLLHESW